MKHTTALTVTSLLSILFFTLHVADDIVRGIEKGGLGNLTAVPIFAVWMYGTLVLSERRGGYVNHASRRASQLGRPHPPHARCGCRG
jgi:hypothetical protein